jgi:hypothetical protein
VKKYQDSAPAPETLSPLHYRDRTWLLSCAILSLVPFTEGNQPKQLTFALVTLNLPKPKQPLWASCKYSKGLIRNV